MVSPGSLKLALPKFVTSAELEALVPGIGKQNSFEVAFATRGLEDSFCGPTVRDAVESALDALENPDGTNPDPFLPAWYRLTRFQREVVNETLKEHAARHMARASMLKVQRSSGAEAEAEWALADAFRAAVDSLVYQDVDDKGRELRKPPLSGSESKGAPSSGDRAPAKAGKQRERTSTAPDAAGKSVPPAQPVSPRRGRGSAARPSTTGD